jgi:aminoglycoside phosphotransferase (APT) family kinase protein
VTNTLDTIPVRPDERLPLERVREFVCSALPDVDAAQLEIEQFPAGHSNLTYLLRSGEWEAVLRRPPLGPVPPRAHDMAREFRILQRLHPVFSRAPKPYVLCEDVAVLGVPFYVMERRRGLVLDQELPSSWIADPAVHRRIAEELVRVLVELHQVDWQTAGLGEIGRPDGYMQRQLSGWIERYARARTADVPDVERLTTWLDQNLPRSPAPTVIHNDYKLNNVLLDPADPTRVSAVLDWEMATVGDPLSDLASLLVYWTEPGDSELMGGLRSVTAEAGFPRRADIMALYGQLSGRDLSQLHWYVAFAYFKVGVILQQIFFRWHQGQTHDDRFAHHEVVASNLLGQAVRAAGLADSP